jgi:hypothetical protein
MVTNRRIARASLALAFFLGFLLLAWPELPLLVSIPSMIASLCLAAWFGAPWLRAFISLLSVESIVDFLSRARQHIAAWSIRDWQPPSLAQIEFGDTFFVSLLKEADAELAALAKEQDRLREDLTNAVIKYGQRGPISGIAQMEAREIPDARAAVFAVAEKIADAQRTVDARLETVQRTFVERLSSGELIAKGLPVIAGETQPEHVIPADQWRVLALNFRRDTASGHGLVYVGIVVGRPRSR